MPESSFGQKDFYVDQTTVFGRPGNPVDLFNRDLQDDAKHREAEYKLIKN